MRTIDIFNTLKDLEGEEFETKRQEFIDEALEKISPKNKKRLEQLLWKTNASLTKIKNPIVRASKAHDIMQESFIELALLLKYGQQK